MANKEVSTRLREWIRRLRDTVRPGRRDDDLEEELRAHLEMAADDAARRGAPPAQAVRQARIASGSPIPAMEALRHQRGMPWLADLARDVRYGVRMLIRQPIFSFVAVISLALGVGANTAVFSIVNAVLLRTLPAQQPHELFFLDVVGSEGGGGSPPYPCFERLRSETTAFSTIAAFATDQLTVQIDGAVEQVFGQVASGNYFDTLGIAPAAGRLLTPEDERVDAQVAVIGYGFWQRRFGGDASAIGRTFRFRDRTYEIVGITPRGFWGLEPGRQVEVTVPITVERQHMSDPGDWWFSAIGRLRPTVSTAAATAQIDGVFQSFIKGRELDGLRSKFFDRMRLTAAAQGGSGLRSRFATPLYALAFAAVLVLLIACANLGSLLLVRGNTRQREFAIRLATGAGAGRLFRQLLTETMLLFVCGGLAGLALAPAAIRALTAFFAVGRTPILLDVPVDWRLAVFALVVASAAAVATAVWPAYRAMHTDPHVAMKDGESRLAGSRRTGRITRALVVAQVVIALVLLVTAVVMVRTTRNLRAADLGFRGAHVVTLSVEPLLPPNATPDTRPQLWRQALDRVRAVPGVQSASLSVLTPLSGRDTSTVATVPGFQPKDDSDRIVHVNYVSEDYFKTFGIALQAGRGITPGDRPGAPNVVLLNEAAARWFFPGRNAIDQQISFGRQGTYRVVGVIADVKHRNLREGPVRFAFVSLWQTPRPTARVSLSVMSSLPAPALVRAIDSGLHAVYPNTLVSEVMWVDEQIDATTVSERLVAGLATGFAALALLLTAVGVYGVLSYSIAQRRTELGIRSALGASPRNLAFNVMRPVLFEVALGTTIGLPLSVGATRLLQGLLFGVSAGDSGQYTLGLGLLAAAATAAAAYPIYQAWSTDPVETLRQQ